MLHILCLELVLVFVMLYNWSVVIYLHEIVIKVFLFDRTFWKVKRSKLYEATSLLQIFRRPVLFQFRISMLANIFIFNNYYFYNDYLSEANKITCATYCYNPFNKKIYMAFVMYPLNV